MKQRRTIRRLVICASIFLLLVTGGAIVNIAVAWGCELLPSRSATAHKLPTEQEMQYWEHGAPAGFAKRPPQVRRHIVGFGWTHTRIYGQLRERPSTIETCSILRAGWPLRSVGGARWSLPTDSASSVPYVHFYDGCFDIDSMGIELGFGLRATRPLVYHPVWPGFAINTLFYAAILWLLLALPGALRRRRRIKRGLCPACAYPVGTSDLCTECGRPVPVRCRPTGRASTT